MISGRGDRLPTMVLESGGGLGKEGPEWPELKLVIDLSKMRKVMLTPGSCERNIRRIGSLQSPNRAPVGEVIGVAVVVGDELLRSGSDGQEALDSEGSSKHHKLGVSLMSEATMFSPSSLPNTSLKIMASLETQTLPKARFNISVSRNTRPVRGLSVRTLIWSW